ncbi:MAG: hypothetical protein GXO90_11845 [FCB group bacterium]|nr:hypothetical protein [FCB group bacterium]
MKSLLIPLFTLALLAGEQGTFSGIVFYQYSVSPDEAITNSFEYSRVYLKYQVRISDQLKYTFISDINPRVSPRTLYLKNAKMDWKTSLGKVVIGVQGMNMFPIQEKTWGYRVVEKSAMDRYGFSSSADLGLGFYPSLNNNIHFSVLITNGPGYKKPENDSYKKVSLRGYLGEARLDKNTGWNSGLSLSSEQTVIGVDSTDRIAVAGLFGGFANDKIRLGLERDVKVHTFEGLGVETIFSGYGNLDLKHFQVFSRLDVYTVDSSKDVYWVSGLVLTPEAGLDIIPLVRISQSNQDPVVADYNLTFQFNF